MNRTDKAKVVESLHNSLKGARSAFLIDFRGLKVVDATELRRRIKRARAGYKVVKNTLARRAFKDTALDQLSEQLRGTTAIAYSKDDPVALARLLTEFARSVPAIAFKAGLVEGRLVQADQIAEIALIPPREELIAKLLFLLNTPVSRLAAVLNAPLRNLASGLKQIAEKK